jgi:hypothetical protein
MHKRPANARLARVLLPRDLNARARLSGRVIETGTRTVADILCLTAI